MGKRIFSDEQVFEAVRELTQRGNPFENDEVVALLKEKYPGEGTPHPKTLDEPIARAKGILEEHRRAANRGRLSASHRQAIRDACKRIEADMTDVAAGIVIDSESRIEEMRSGFAADAAIKYLEITQLKSELSEKEKNLATARDKHAELLEENRSLDGKLREAKGKAAGYREMLRDRDIPPRLPKPGGRGRSKNGPAGDAS